MKCKFSQHGCRVELIKTRLGNHEKYCKFVPVQCPILDCDTKVHISKVIHHLSTTKAHRVNHIQDYELSFKYEMNWDTNRTQNPWNWPTAHLELDGEHFYLQFVRMPNGVWFSWVYIIGTKKLAQNYIYTLKLTGENEISNLSCKRNVVSIYTPKEEITKPMVFKAGLVFSDDVILELWPHNQIFEMQCYVCIERCYDTQ